MYHILLVDDEDEVRESIAHLMNWESLGFQVVAQARDGVEALEKVERYLPDIVFTDISMPYMNGLELVERLYKEYPAVKVIIFSGHEEFEYAKKALSFNVLDYILKPVNLEELAHVFEKIHGVLDEQIQQMRDVSLLRKKFITNLPLLRQKYYQDLTEQKMPLHTALRLMDEYQIETLQGKQYLCAKVVVQTHALRETDELTQLSVQQIVDQYALQMYKGVTFQDADGICGIFVDVASASDIVMLFDNIAKEVRKILDVDVFVGVGDVHDGLLSVSASYDEAVLSLNYQHFQDVGNVIFINDIKSVKEDDVTLNPQYEQALFDAIKLNAQDKIAKVVASICTALSSSNLRDNKRSLYAMQVLTMMLSLVQRYEIEADAVFAPDTNFLTLVEELSTATALHDWLCRTLEVLHTVLSQTMSTKGNDMVRQAKRYIAENFNNTALSLETICQHLHISPTYFSSVFKKETGENFVSYVTKVRIERAVVLLNTTTDKSYAIAQQVGFSEPAYFNYVFKKQMGVTPAKFRNKG